jgi:DNA helicase-2/ATP-dependent DNA helicase PcrA
MLNTTVTSAKDISKDILNENQRIAIEHDQGPMLILAGAGSGKTKLITHKYAYLLNKYSSDSELENNKSTVLVVTFSSTAADDMRLQISQILSQDYQDNALLLSQAEGNLDDIWIGTFHYMCNRILREDIHAIGYNNNFIVYDSFDQSVLIKHILKDLNIYEALYMGIASKIDYFKTSMITPEELLQKGSGYDFDEKIVKVYMRYQDELKKTCVLDFNDLVMLTIRLFEENPDILEKYRNIFSHILVDEFQDINSAQYKLLHMMANSSKNICVVGDDDQSIYKFKGSDVDNILTKFEQDFPQSCIVKLEQTYRCSQNILDASHSVIYKNIHRRAKQLWTTKGSGEKVNHHWFMTEEEEARYITKTIKDLYLKGDYTYDQIAILYRVNLVSKILENHLKAERIPFDVIGDTNVFSNKDIISYIRLALNKDDNVSLRRIINIPPRGIGSATIKKIELLAKKEGISLYQAAKNTLQLKGISSLIKEKLSNFILLIDDISTHSYDNVVDAIKYIDNLIGYTSTLDDAGLKSLLEMMADNAETKLVKFLDTVSLKKETDFTSSPLSNKGRISLTTLHNVKGLEFPVVFITGLEEGLLPHFKASSSTDLEVERRLFYVGMTRASDRLFVTGAKRRRIYAKYQTQEPSRFLLDMPRECCHWAIQQPIVIQSTLKQKQAPPVLAPPIIFPYNTGCRVRHPKWGVGVIRDCYGESGDVRVTVNFPDVGIKRLSLKFANLERI